MAVPPNGEPESQPLGWVQPGAPLAYVERLAQQDAWPPAHATRSYDGPTATSYLVIAASQNDLGDRPLAGTDVLHSASIQLLDEAGNVVVNPDNGITYRLRCTVVNRGVVAAYGGLADFYVAQRPTSTMPRARPGHCSRLSDTPASSRARGRP